MVCGCRRGLCQGGCGNGKVRASLVSAALFAVVASPQLFGLTQRLLGGLFRVASASGSPTLAGLALHAAVYGLAVYAFMHFRGRRDGFGEGEVGEGQIYTVSSLGRRSQVYCSNNRPFRVTPQTVIKAAMKGREGAGNAGNGQTRWVCPSGQFWGWGENSGKCCEAGNKNCKSAVKG